MIQSFLPFEPDFYLRASAGKACPLITDLDILLFSILQVLGHVNREVTILALVISYTACREGGHIISRNAIDS